MDETYGAISMFVSPVLTNIKSFSYMVIVSHLWDKITSFPISHNMPCTYMNHMCDNSARFCLSAYCTSHGFTLQYLSSKTLATFTNKEFPPGVTIVFVNDGFAGRNYQWKEERPQTGPKYVHVIQRVHTKKVKSHICKLSEITSKRIVFVVFQIAL